MLKAGGNAVDAAVAVMAALGFVEPYSCGIGGGGFMVIYWKKTGEVITIDGRETAPLSANVKMFEDPDNPGNNLPFAPNRISNGAAVGVPGTVALWRARWSATAQVVGGAAGADHRAGGERHRSRPCLRGADRTEQGALLRFHLDG